MTQLDGAAARAVDVNDLIDGQSVQRSTIIYLVIATLAMVGDGFDIAVIGYVAPELVKQWHISPAQLAPALTAGLFGLLVGAPLLGYVGDRLGRKKAILIGLCIYGALTMVTMAASSLNQFVVLRFLTAIGLGGMIPNILALTAEIAPKRLRGKFTIIVLFGVPAGLALPGWVAALLVPLYGWPVLLLVGGLLPLVIALFALFLLPESLKFLMQRGGRDNEVRRLASALRPDILTDAKTRFTANTPNAVAAGGGSPTKLFAAGLALITPALWIALAANQMANFFTISWLPTLLQSAGLSTAQAGISASMFSIGGLAGGVVFTFLIDRLGVLPIVGFFILGAPLIALIGIPDVPLSFIGAIIAGAGFCVTGNNFGINAAMVMIYPTPIRAIGAGWAQAVGRIGSLAAPIIGGILLGMHLPTWELFLAPASALVIGAVAAGILALLCKRRFNGYRLDEASAADSARQLAECGSISLSEIGRRRQQNGGG